MHRPRSQQRRLRRVDAGSRSKKKPLSFVLRGFFDEAERALCVALGPPRRQPASLALSMSLTCAGLALPLDAFMA